MQRVAGSEQKKSETIKYMRVYCVWDRSGAPLPALQQLYCACLFLLVYAYLRGAIGCRALRSTSSTTSPVWKIFKLSVLQVILRVEPHFSCLKTHKFFGKDVDINLWIKNVVNKMFLSCHFSYVIYKVLVLISFKLKCLMNSIIPL
jgi:hypothetical protein